MEYLKKPLNASLSKFATQKAQSQIQLAGKSLPCSVTAVVSPGIVRVKFELTNIPFTLPEREIPVQGSEYALIPIQVGDKGYAQAADAHLGGVSGLGGGTADLTQPANLSALSFVWLGNTEWSSPDANAYVVRGPNGVILTDMTVGNSLTLSPTKFGVFNESATQQTITGPLSTVSDAAAKTVLTSIIAVLVAYGLAIDGTT